MQSMSDILAISQILKLGWALAAFGLVFLVLRLRDYFIRLNIEESVREIEKNPIAAAIYLSVTFFAACMLVGQLIS